MRFFLPGKSRFLSASIPRNGFVKKTYVTFILLEGAIVVNGAENITFIRNTSMKTIRQT